MELINLASKPDPEALAQRIIERKRQLPTALSAATVLEHRDADRR